MALSNKSEKAVKGTYEESQTIIALKWSGSRHLALSGKPCLQDSVMGSLSTRHINSKLNK